IAALLFVAVPASARQQPTGGACDTTWNGADGDWSQQEHWDNGVPDGTKHACLPPGSYTVTITSESAETATLVVGAGARLSLETATCGAAGALLTLHGPMSNAGTVELAPCDGTAHIVVPPGAALTNDGTISATGNLGDRVLSGIVTNNGMVSFNTTTGQAHLDGAGLFDNHGSVTIADGATPTITGGAGYTFHNGASGSVLAAGSGQLVVESGNTFDEGQGGVSGNPVLLTGGSTLSFSGNGASTFALQGSNTLAGSTIGAS